MGHKPFVATPHTPTETRSVYRSEPPAESHSDERPVRFWPAWVEPPLQVERMMRERPRMRISV